MTAPDRKPVKRDAMAKVKIVRAVLRGWAPIPVTPGTSAPADEYDSYAFHIVSKVNAGCSVKELAAHLEKLRTVEIGVGADRERDMEIAAQIIAALLPSNTALERTRER